ncbi:MAG: hypothetical protein ABIG55_00970 [Candidatus Omnitrophota bacterium]|nr:hypothetical protein [Candidatus Omnitrophota bacterium]
MRKNGILLMLLAGIVLMELPGIAEQKDTGELPPGMKAIKVGTATIVAPQGIRTIRVADIIQLESMDQYVARTFLDFEERMKDLEAREEELTEELKELKKEIQKEKSPPPEGEENIEATKEPAEETTETTNLLRTLPKPL